MRVSSKHMILASAVFKVMLSHKFKEGVTLQTQGVLKLPLLGDDPAALLIMLNIIHGHTRKVPRQVDLYTLTQIAILVDKYAIHEAVEVFSEIWIEDLNVDIPTAFTKDIVPWLCISWVFKRSIEFEKMTHIALWGFSDDITPWTGPHPIPETVIG